MTSPLLADRVQETTTTTGTGTLTLGGATTGCRTFNSVFSNGNVVYYVIDDGAGNWEVGSGTVGAGTLTRSTVYSSSNAGSLVVFGVGSKTVYCDASANVFPAGNIVGTSDTQTLSNKTLTNPTINGFTGNTSVVNIGSGQFYKDTSGNVGIGTSSPSTYSSGGSSLVVSKSASASNVIGASLVNPNGTANTAVSLDFVPNTNIALAQIQALRTAVGGTTDLLFSTYTGSVLNEKMRLDSSGNLGLGVTPSAWNSGAKAMQILTGAMFSGSGYAYMSQNHVYGAGGDVFLGSGYATAYGQTNGVHKWLVSTVSGTAGNAISFTQAMTLDASGQLQLGTTVAAGGKFKVLAGTNIAFGVQASTAVSGAVTLNAINENNTANVPLDLRCSQLYVSTGITAGAGTNALKYSTSSNAFTYDTSSARYKNNIRDSVYGLGDVLQLRSAMFEYKNDGRTDIGLIAEEVFDVIPELVPLDSEGRPDAVSYDRMVSVLIKAIQELSAKNSELESRLAALEGKA